MPAEKNQIQPEISTLKNKKEEVQLVKPEPLRNLLEWRAPVRPFKKRGKEFFSTVLTIVFLISVILLFLKEWLLIAVIIALTFVVYVMGTIPPEEVEHKITNRGIVTGGKNYRWEQLGRFWFEEKWGQKILYVENFGFPRALMMLLGQKTENEVKKILSEYLLQEQPEKNWLDKASSWLSQKIPLEEETK